MKDSVLARLLKTGTLFLISLLLALGVGEMLIRCFYPQQLIRGTGLYQLDPVVGWRRRTSNRVVVNTGDGPVVFATDERGFRVNAVKQERKIQPQVSLLMLGDSFVEALAVEYEKTISYQIQQALQEKYSLETEVFNAGVGGWSPAQYWYEAKQRLSQSHYDLGIIFFFVGNDCLDEQPLQFAPTTLEADMTVKVPKDWKWESLKRDVFFPVNNFLEMRSHLFVFLKNRFQIFLGRIGLTACYFPDIFYRDQDHASKWNPTIQLAEKIDQEFQGAHVPVLFVLIPTDYQVYPEKMWTYMKMFDIRPEAVDLDQPDRKLAAGFREKGLPVVDLLPFFREKARRGLALYGIDRHLNAAGHTALTEALLPKIYEMLQRK